MRLVSSEISSFVVCLCISISILCQINCSYSRISDYNTEKASQRSCSSDLNETDHDPAYCGYLQLQSNGTQYTALVWVDVTLFCDHKKDLNFSDVHKLQIHSLFVDKVKCSIKICGFSNGAGDKYDNGSCEPFVCGDKEGSNGHCRTTIPNNIPKIPYNITMFSYEITAIEGGSTDRTPENCSETFSNTPKKLLLNNHCAYLYQEDEYQDCSHAKIELKDGDEYSTKNSAVIRSVKVHEGCSVIQKTFGNLQTTYNVTHTMKIVDYKSGLKPSYYKNGENFTCDCSSATTDATTGTTSTTEITTTPVPDLPPITPLVIGVILLQILLIVAVGFIVWLRHQPRTIPGTPSVVSRNVPNDGNRCDERLLTNSTPTPLPSTLNLKTEFQISRNRLVIDLRDPFKVIGKGAFGTVYKAELWELDGSKADNVAVKTIDNLSHSGDMRFFINEINNMAFVGRHPNIVHFLGACAGDTEREIYCIMELCPLGSLKAYLNCEREHANLLSERSSSHTYATQHYVQIGVSDSSVSQKLFSQFLKWSEEIASGMEYLSQKNVLHIDLAARNVLLSGNLVAKICDFGMSKKLYDREYYDRMGIIPLKWVALECLTKNKYSVKSDVWAYGVTIWEIFSVGNEPYCELRGFDSIRNYLLSGARLDRPELATEEIFSVMLKCWEAIPSRRPSFSQLQNFFQHLRASSLMP